MNAKRRQTVERKLTRVIRKWIKIPCFKCLGKNSLCNFCLGSGKLTAVRAHEEDIE